MKNITSQVVKTLFTIAAIALGLWLLYMVRSVIVYTVISAILALVGKPLVEWLRNNKRMPFNRNVAAALTLLVMVALFGGVFALFIPALITELQVVSEIEVSEIFHEIEVGLSDVSKNFSDDGQKPTIEDGALRDALSNYLNFENISGTFEQLLSGLGNLVFAIFSIIFMTFFFLRENHLFRNIILALVPDRFEERILSVAPRLKSTLSRYFLGLIIQVSAITGIVSIGLSIVGFENTLVIGFFTGLVNLIPYFGPIIGGSFGLLLGISQQLAGNLDYSISSLSILIVIVFACVQFIDNFILQPLIFSTSINAHPLEIFVVILAAGSLGGISGMIIAVPLYSVLRLLAAEFFPEVKVVKKLTANLNKDAVK